MRVAVTGGSGKIGSAVIRELVARGHTVWNLDRRQAHTPVPGVKFCFVDLRKREQVQPIFHEVDAVCHLGEIPNPGVGLSPEEIFATNVQIGSTVLQAAADLRLKHVVYTSSCQVYGAWGWPIVPPVSLPMDETHPLLPQNAYSLSKVANEGYARFVSKEYGLSVSIFRLPRTLHSFDERTVAWFERDEHVSEFGTYVMTADAATGYAAAVEKAYPGCEVYQLVADDVCHAGPIGPALLKALPNGPYLPTDWPSHKSPALADKARTKLGWSPKSNFLEEYRKKRGREPLLVMKA